LRFRALYLEERPRNGTLTLAQGGRYTYLPRQGFTGTDSFRLEICADFRGNDHCTTLQYYVTVQ
jgi:hypothetical protein